MTDTEMDVLRILRVFGPCSNSTVGRKLGIAPDKTYRIIQGLCQRGFVVHPKLQQWNLSFRGRRAFEAQPNRPLALFVESV